MEREREVVSDADAIYGESIEDLWIGRYLLAMMKANGSGRTNRKAMESERKREREKARNRRNGIVDAPTSWNCAEGDVEYNWIGKNTKVFAGGWSYESIFSILSHSSLLIRVSNETPFRFIFSLDVVNALFFSRISKNFIGNRDPFPSLY